MRYLTVGELSKNTHVTKVAIRYYERLGLLPMASRRASGYRAYPETALDRIRFIKNAKFVGFSLEEIHDLLNLQSEENTTSQQIKSFVLDKYAIMQEKIAALNKMLGMLDQLASSCDGKVPLCNCPILEALNGEIEEKLHL